MEFTEEFTEEKCQGTGTYQDTGPSAPGLTINRLPDEVLLEIFDYYRQNTYPYYYQWRTNYAWLNLAHVCTRWRAIMFTSSSRLDLSIIVGAQKPGHIKTVLSGPLPISIENTYEDFVGDIADSAIWRMRAALRHRDRVREISIGRLGFYGKMEWVDFFFEKFIRATNFHFPALESLTIYFVYGHTPPEFPATFLRGPDQSDLRLRRLELYDAPLASLSGLLLSATALTDLTLGAKSRAATFDPPQGLLTCLQGLKCLRRLVIETLRHPQDSQPYHSTSKDIVTLSKLTRFHYSGPVILLNYLMSGLSTPSLQDAHFMIDTGFPLLDLSRVIDDLRNEFWSIKVIYDVGSFHLFSESTYSAKIDRFKSCLAFTVYGTLNSVSSLSSTPSTKLAMVEELALFLDPLDIEEWEHDFSLREFLRQFCNVRVLRVNPFVPEVGIYLHEDRILPLLEEIELSILRSTGDSDEEYQRRAAEALAAFEPLAAARERAGSVVKVYLREPE